VIYKQLQIYIKYTFKFVFLLHVLILKAENQLFLSCKPMFMIWIQVIVIFNFITFVPKIYSCGVSRNLRPLPLSSVQCTQCRHFCQLCYCIEWQDSMTVCSKR
jgi:hypothetical protein